MSTAILPTNPLFDAYALIRTLGRGGEGTIYLVREKATNERFVLKVRHKPIVGSATAGLKLYASQIAPNSHGLPVISLLGDPDEIIAIAYPFMPLYPIYWRIPVYFESAAQTIFGAYCRMQNYLLSRANIALLDPVKDNFMIATDGQIHFVDFGFGIRSTQHPQVLDEGKLGYGFAMLLLSLYNQNLKLEMMPMAGYVHDQPCVYCASKSLDRLAADHPWVDDLLREVRQQNASVFFDAGFYQQIGERLPDLLPWSALIVGAARVHHYWKTMRVTSNFPRKAHSAG
jgi:hypothetical protein